MHEKADEFARKLGVEDNWKSSEGWLIRFKKREGLVHKKLHGEATDADVTEKENWITTVWPRLFQQYGEEDIFNADETGIYFRAMPNSTLTFQNDIRRGTKNRRSTSLVWWQAVWLGKRKSSSLLGSQKIHAVLRM